MRTLRARFLYLCFLIRLRKWNGISFIFPSSSLFFFFLKLQLSFVTAKQLVTISFIRSDIIAVREFDIFFYFFSFQNRIILIIYTCRYLNTRVRSLYISKKRKKIARNWRERIHESLDAPSETDIPRIQQEAIFPSFWIDSRVSGVQKFVALGIVEYEERRLGR